MIGQQTIPMVERPTNIQHPENKNIIVYIRAKDYIKLRAYVEQVNTEISGFARVDPLEGGHFLVSNFKIFDQINSPGHTEMYEEAISKYTLDAVKEDIDVNKELKCWWHSHCKMGTFWSMIDENQIEDHDTKMEEDNWKLSLETNHAGSLMARIDVYYPARYTVAGLTVKVDYSEEEVFEAVQKEIEEYCNEYKYEPPKTGKKKETTRVDMEEWRQWEEELETSQQKSQSTAATVQKATQMSSVEEIQERGWNRNVYPHQKNVTIASNEEIPDEIPTEDFEKEMEKFQQEHNEDIPQDNQQLLLPPDNLSLESMPQNTPDPQAQRAIQEMWDQVNPDPKRQTKIWVPERGD